MYHGDLLYKVVVNGRKRHELWAEAIRDIGILFFVFAPLDTLLRISFGTWDWHWLIAVGVASLGLLLIEKGVRMDADTESET